MSAIGYVKEHPFIVGGAAVVIIGGALLLFGSSGNASETGAMNVTQAPIDPNQVAAGQAAQQANIALQAQTLQTTSEKEVALATINATAASDKYKADTSFKIADLAAKVHLADLASINLTNTLKAKADAAKLASDERVRANQIAVDALVKANAIKVEANLRQQQQRK